MIGCDAYNNQPCQVSYGAVKLSFVPCCRYCEKYNTCKRAKCENDPDKCGKVDYEAVKMDGRRNGRAVEKIDAVTGEVLEVYETIKSASEAVGMSNTTICNACKGHCKTAGGYKWRYVEDEEIL